ncbi:MAG: hypothetical protein H6876_01965 [Hyphomicrobiaceae bacterium]|nr:hypothetical protein [Hyphomicrobiaceae bacterium]MCC0006876.1 hypothetical protein [Hyphomicrobiaceae bacterium]
MIADNLILTYVFLGLVVFLFGMIFWNVLGGPRRSRRKRGSSSRGQASPDGSGGFDAGIGVGHRGGSRRDDGAGGGEDSSSDGGDGGGGGGGDGGGGD